MKMIVFSFHALNFIFRIYSDDWFYEILNETNIDIKELK